MSVSVYCDDTELGTGNVRHFLVTVFTLSGRLEMWKCPANVNNCNHCYLKMFANT